jgi:ribonuclease BN (tRNA processing enzyme)
MPTDERPEGTTLQRQLSSLLYGELLHTFGSYRLAGESIGAVRDDLEAISGRNLVPLEEVLIANAKASFTANRRLRELLYKPQPPDVSGSAAPRRPSPFEDGRRWKGPDEDLVGEIAKTYAAIGTGLGVYHDGLERKLDGYENRSGGDRLGGVEAETLGERFAYVQDPRGEIDANPLTWERIVSGQVHRAWFRRAQAIRLLTDPSGTLGFASPPPVASAGVEALLGGSIDSDGNELLRTVLQAMNEAHLWMHYAEHIESQSFGRAFPNIPAVDKELREVLQYALVLNTFAFVTARSAPWIFAEDEKERAHVLANFRECRRTLAPTYCMWLSTQVSLLALHRRAFTWRTMGRPARAYRDFHKLCRILSELRRPAEDRALRVPGTKTFINGMTAISELHIGRIYRGQHAHRMALNYFKRSSAHLKGWEREAEVGEAMQCSVHRVNLLLNRAKAHYELGQVTRGILFYARAWRAFLLLVQSETGATANTDVVMAFIEWIAWAAKEPELSRRELGRRLVPLVDQFRTLRSPENLRLLAADIVYRMGHLLRVLNLPPEGEGVPSTDHTLAWRCISQAAFLDPTSTLIATDYLKLKSREDGEDVEYAGDPVKPDPYEPPPLSAQWPSGGSDFESAARITEYTLQRWLRESAERDSPEGKISRELLEFFLAHSDSSNVKLAQVYRYLMREPRDEETEVEHREHSLDFVCLRRYSSFFPFLPRPSAFRAPGGGYLVQLREPGSDSEPFGIAIDPGPDFLENLYRVGYSLADIQMIVVSHDHADHIASLDALMALLYHRKSLGDRTFDRDGGRLLVIGNESVCRRYGFYNQMHPTEPDEEDDKSLAERRDAVCVLDFEAAARALATPVEERGENRERVKVRVRREEVASKDAAPVAAVSDDADPVAKYKEVTAVVGPPGLRIEPVQTYRHADAHGHMAQGFLLSFGPEASAGEDEEEARQREEARPSILFAGDSGLPAIGEDPKDHHLARGEIGLREAVREADLVVAHLSSASLPELRRLAGMDRAVTPDVGRYQALWQAAAATAGRRRAADEPERKGIERTEFLLKQVQFGFRTRAAEGHDQLSVTPFSPLEEIKSDPPQHLYLTGLIEIAKEMATASRRGKPLLLIGELREELGTFRTRIARGIEKHCFHAEGERGERRRLGPSALTADIGLRVRLLAAVPGEEPSCSVLCTTCDLDTDLLPAERFHAPREVREVCVKGEDEGVFYTCAIHDPQRPEDRVWVEAVERYNVFGD